MSLSSSGGHRGPWGPRWGSRCPPGVGDVPDGDALVLIVDLVQQQPVGHAELGVAQDLLPLQLEEDDGDGLVHPGGEQLVLLAVLVGVGAGELDGEAVGRRSPCRPRWQRRTGGAGRCRSPSR